MPDQAISAHSSGDPTSTSLLVVVNNSTTMKTTLDEAVGFVTTAAGDMMYAAGARNMARLAPGSSYQTLTMSSAATAPAWFTPPNFHLVNATSQTVDTTGAAGAINLTWLDEVYDTDGTHSTATNPERVTCNTPGKYWVEAHIQSQVAPTKLLTFLKVSGGSTITLWQHQDGVYNVSAHIQGLIQMSSGDYVYATLRYDGTTGGVNGSTQTTFFMGYWIGP